MRGMRQVKNAPTWKLSWNFSLLEIYYQWNLNWKPLQKSYLSSLVRPLDSIQIIPSFREQHQRVYLYIFIKAKRIETLLSSTVILCDQHIVSPYNVSIHCYMHENNENRQLEILSWFATKFPQLTCKEI